MTAHSELLARPALRHLAFRIVHSLATGVLAGAAMTTYWGVLTSPPNGQQFAFGIAIMASVIFFCRPQPDGEKT